MPRKVSGKKRYIDLSCFLLSILIISINTTAFKAKATNNSSSQLYQARLATTTPTKPNQTKPNQPPPNNNQNASNGRRCHLSRGPALRQVWRQAPCLALRHQDSQERRHHSSQRRTNTIVSTSTQPSPQDCCREAGSGGEQVAIIEQDEPSDAEGLLCLLEGWTMDLFCCDVKRKVRWSLQGMEFARIPSAFMEGVMIREMERNFTLSDSMMLANAGTSIKTFVINLFPSHTVFDQKEICVL